MLMVVSFSFGLLKLGDFYETKSSFYLTVVSNDGTAIMFFYSGFWKSFMFKGEINTFCLR